jgi:3-hydroxyacyl-[acyl-carrier-protein] dehydratase
MHPLEEILSLLPHRPPFLWVDRILDCADDWIITEKDISPDLDLFHGHYPGNPIMPGVLLCEAIFQSGALLMAKRKSGLSEQGFDIPVLTRIGAAKFKRSVYPGDSVQIKVTLSEILANACFFQGVLRVQGKLAVSVDFACAMVNSPP